MSLLQLMSQQRGSLCLQICLGLWSHAPLPAPWEGSDGEQLFSPQQRAGLKCQALPPEASAPFLCPLLPGHRGVTITTWKGLLHSYLLAACRSPDGFCGRGSLILDLCEAAV